VQLISVDRIAAGGRSRRVDGVRLTFGRDATDVGVQRRASRCQWRVADGRRSMGSGSRTRAGRNIEGRWWRSMRNTGKDKIISTHVFIRQIDIVMRSNGLPLGAGDRSSNIALRCDASFGQCIVARIEIFPILQSPTSYIHIKTTRHSISQLMNITRGTIING
jgi:hypothetical protein